MPTIQPDTLIALRNNAGQKFSQKALAETSKVGLRTIKRIEHAQGAYDANEDTAKRLAHALGVTVDDLSRPANDPAIVEAKAREVGYRPFKAFIRNETALAFELVEARYGISTRAQILMAPLFAALLAEGSLVWRREKLAEIREAADTLTRLGEGHLSFATVYRVQDGATAEEDSISRRDLFGREVADIAYELGYDPARNNPFADYLRDFATRLKTSEIAFPDDELGGWGAPDELPKYQIAPDYLEWLTGGDPLAEYALARGYAHIRDVPEDLRGEDKQKERAEWLAGRVPAEEREKREAQRNELSIEL